MDTRAYSEMDKRRIDRKLTDEIKKSGSKIVVLDDDPTGTQTVHDVPVYLDWNRESIEAGFGEEADMFYILTNSRGLTAGETEAVHRDIARTVCQVSEETGKPFILISRSDSTLRGHYPLETETLRETIEDQTPTVIRGEILCPFFEEGGRYTRDNIHYVQYKEIWVPAAETEFAADPTFGFQSSDLRRYVEEKTEGRYRAEDVVCISLEDLRGLDWEGITGRLMEVQGFNKVVVNAVDYYDLKVFCIGLYRAMAMGRNYLFRTAASFVKVMGGIQDRPLLAREEMIGSDQGRGGVIIIGSYTEKTTGQLEELRKCRNTECIEFDSDLVGDKDRFDAEVERVVQICSGLVSGGKTVAVYTKRKKLQAEDCTGEEALRCSVRISEGITSVAGRLEAAPLFVLAKGGITSSDVAVKALKQRRSVVIGQILPGIPVWRTGNESRYPGIPYVVFPGNVGEAEGLRLAVEKLLGVGGM